MKIIPHNKPTIGIEEKEAASRVLSSGWLAQGEEVNSFENEFCDFLGLPHGHAVAVTSGTSALYLALWGLNAKGKTVAYPTYVCSALRNAVRLIEGNELLIDNSVHSPNIDVSLLNAARADIAIVPHMYGIPVNIKEIERKLIIEDCCQSLGSKIDGTFVGLIGNVGIFSFYATKLITSGGQGGMVVAKNKSLIDEIRDYREFDQRTDNKTRFNFQMTDLQASIGRIQLKKLPHFLKQREVIYQKYRSAGFELLDTQISTSKPIRYRSVLVTNKSQELKDKLESNGIRTIIPIEEWELLDNTQLFKNALRFSANTLSLPCYPLLSNVEQDYIISKLKNEL